MRADSILRLGRSVAVYGNNIAVGAPGVEGGGVVFVLRDVGNNGIWSNDFQFKSINAHDGDKFGYSMGLSQTRFFIGAPHYSLNNTHIQAGTAFAYAAQGTRLLFGNRFSALIRIFRFG